MLRLLPAIRRFGPRATVASILITHVTLLGWQAYRDSPTWDEVGHFAAGLDHWANGRSDLYCVNPPLVRLVALFPEGCRYSGVNPQVFRDNILLVGRPEFGTGVVLAAHYGPDYFFRMTTARWACIPFSIVGAGVCFVWARELWGRAAGLVALTLWSFCPNVLAHAHLITPDAGAAALGVSAAYLFWRWLRNPGWAAAAVAGAVLGLAQLTKTTWLMLFALWPLLWLLYRWLEPRAATRAGPGFAGQLLQLGVLLLLAMSVLNLGYGFEGSFKPLGSYRFVSRSLSGGPPRSTVPGNRFTSSWLGTVPVPVPENYVKGIDIQKSDFERKMPSYLRGEWRLGGWWYYYLYALLNKVPIGTWMILVLAFAVSLFLRGYSAPLRDELVLWLPIVAVMVLVSSQTGFNHHLRYVLPIFPFAFIWMSKVARSVELRQWPVVCLGGLALAGSVVSSLLVHPHSLSYFNELAGGPENGHRHLANSNTDWGQDLLYLKRWLDRHPEARAEPLSLAYDLPLIDPRMAGIEHRRAPADPQPGWHAISVNHLHRRDGAYDYFLELEPAARAGYSINIYYVTAQQVAALRLKRGLPPMSPPS
jgi:hypothetical protein